MTISLFSFFMAMFWFSAFILFGTLLQRKTSLVICGQIVPLLILLTLTVFRLVIPFEAPFTQVIQSTQLYPMVRNILRLPWGMVGAAAVSGVYVLLGLWVGGAVVLCFRLCLRLYRDHCVVKALPAVACPNAERCLERLLRDSGYTGKVGLIASPDVSTPMLVGLSRPRILLPQACDGFSERELQGILLHEFTHLSSGDIWVKLLIRIFCCLMWWNPCVYLLQKDLDHVLEYKCDLAVTKSMDEQEKLTYLQTILAVLSQMERRPLSKANQTLQAGLCGISETTILKQRFQLVLHQGRRQASSVAYIAVLLMMFVASYSVVVQPASYPPAEDLIGEMKITTETSYIQAGSDDTYYLVYEGEKIEKLAGKSLQGRPYCDLEIINETESN